MYLGVDRAVLGVAQRPQDQGLFVRREELFQQELISGNDEGIHDRIFGMIVITNNSSTQIYGRYLRLGSGSANRSRV